MRRYFPNYLKIAILLVVYLFGNQSYAQITSTGNDFWFNFMHQHSSEGRTYDLKVFISSDVNASGNISSPGGWSQNFNVTANSTTVLTVPTDVGHVTIADAIANQGLHITSDNDINVFALNYSLNTTDGSLILPTNAIGDDYYILTYQPLNSAERSGFSIVATENNTQIRIIPSKATTGGHPANTPYDITIDRGQVYQVESTEDLTGSRVFSIGTKKKIAVFGGATCVNIPPGYAACDHLFEQMFPNNTLRRNFVAIPFDTRTKGDTYRVLAIKNNTTITFNGGSPMNLDAGQWQETSLSGSTYISSNYPISVAQYSNGSTYDGVVASDPFFIMLSPVEQVREDITFEVFNFANITGNYLNIAAKTSCTGEIKLDGVTVTGWAVVPGNAAYSFVQKSVSQGPHRLVSAKDCGFNAYVYGYGNADSYGYSAGVRLDTLAIAMTTNTDCAGSGSEFYVASYPYPITNYNWDFGDGGTSSAEKPVHIYQSGGNYTVTLIVTYDNSDKDTVVQNFVITEPKAIIEYSGGPCVFSDVFFTDKSVAIGGSISSRVWTFGDGGSDVTQNPTHTYTSDGIFTVILKVTTSNGCVGSDSIKVTILPLPEPRITPSGPIDICTCDSILLDAGPGFVNYLWSNGQTTQTVILKDQDDYTVTVTDTNGCVNTSPPVRVNVIQPQASITLGNPAYSVEPGQIITVPVYISQSANLDFCNSRNFILDLSFNKFIMVPDGSTPPGVFDNDLRRIQITGVRDSNSDTLALLSFMGTLGDVVASQITIDDFNWTDCNFVSRTINSDVALSGLCAEGGTTRLYKSPQSVLSMNISPNPVTGETKIKYELMEETVINIFITDISAGLQTTLVEGIQKKGEHEIIFNTEHLYNGSYLIVIQTPSGTASTIMEVLR